MPVTLKEIAAVAGVAPNTVSTILNGKKNWTSEETRKRVIEAANRLGYKPNRLARGLRLGKYLTMGLIVPDLLNPYYALFARSLEKVLDANGYDLLIEDSEASLAREQLCLSRISEHQIDGLVCSLMDPQGCSPKLKSLVENGRPVVCIGRVPAELNVDVFRSDFSQGISEAILHLKELGHLKIAFVSGLPEGQSEDGQRFRFFRTMVLDSGLSFTEKLYIRCGHSMAHAREAFTKFWKSTPDTERPTAVIALNDLLAIGVMRSCLDLGLHIPQDVSIIGIDNTEIADNLPTRLTSIAQSYEEMAAAAAHRLIARCRNSITQGQTDEVIMPTRLIIRESTGRVCKHTHEPQIASL